MAATNVQAFSGDVVLGEATYRYKKSWTAGTGGKAYVYMGNVKSTDTSGIRINFTAGTNPGVTMIDISSTLHNLDTGHTGGNMINFIHGNAPGTPADSIDLGYVYVSADSSYQLWIEDPSDDTLGTVTAYINCQGYYNYDTTVSDVAQGGAAPTNFQRGIAALAIEKGGPVGIGTNDTTSSAQLEIRGPTSTAINQGQVVIGYKELGTEDSNVIAIQFKGYNGSEDTPLGSIQIERESTTNGNNDTRMILYTRADGSAQAEALRLMSDKKVGIGGITSPAESLEVSGNYRAGRTTGGYTFGLDSGGDLKAGIYSDSTNPLIFRTGADSEKMRILNSGNTGIGTDTPGDLLELHSTGGTDNVGMIVGNGDRKWRVGIRGDTSDSFAIQDDEAGQIRATCNTSGVWDFPAGFTPRTINGVSFNGTTDINVLPYINNYDTGDTSCYLIFTRDSSAGHKSLYEDSGLVYDSTNNEILLSSLQIDDYIYHKGDTNTYFGFNAADNFRIAEGGTVALQVNTDSTIDIQSYIKHAGDTNTYIGFSGNDTIAMRTSNSERLIIDSSGRIRMPAQPAFWAYQFGGAAVNNETTAIGFNSALVNNGGHYSGNTGRFTAPVTGNYCFHAGGLHRRNTGNGTLELTFYRNNSNLSGRGMGLTFLSAASLEITQRIHTIVNLSASQYVTFGIHAINSVTDFYYGERLGNFSGFLIG